jgi:hypothetical protein
MGTNHDKRSEAEASEQRQPYSWLTICSECGSLNVQITAWVFANRDASVDTGSDAPSDDAWCNRCEDHVGTETLYVDDNGLWSVDTICTKGIVRHNVLPLRAAIRAVRECGLNRRKAVQAPCIDCGRSDLPLHYNRRCTECGP